MCGGVCVHIYMEYTYMCIHRMYIYMNVTTMNENKSHKFERDQGGKYGGIWQSKRTGEMI